MKKRSAFYLSIVAVLTAVVLLGVTLVNAGAAGTGIPEDEINALLDALAQKDSKARYKAPLCMGFDIQDFPNAYARFANEITLPLHTCLTDEMVDWVIGNFSRIVREYVTPTDGRKDGAHV